MSREEQAAYRRYIDNRVILADQIVTARGEGKLEGHAEGYLQGREKGREEERIAVARKLKSMGLPDMDIAKATSLTLEELKQL